MNQLQDQAGTPPDKQPHPVSALSPSATLHLIGERVRQARIAAQLTQHELAGETYSKSYISAVERGKMAPSWRALRFLAERLGVTLPYLLGEVASQQSIEAPEAPAEDDEQEARIRGAERILHQGRYEEAIDLFEHIGQPDRTSWAHEQFAHFLAEQGRYQEAYEQMGQALQQNAS